MVDKSDFEMRQSLRQEFPLGRSQRHTLYDTERSPEEEMNDSELSIKQKLDDLAPRIHDLIDDILLIDQHELVDPPEDFWNELTQPWEQREWAETDLPNPKQFSQIMRDQNNSTVLLGLMMGRLTHALQSLPQETRGGYQELIAGFILGLSDRSERTFGIGEGFGLFLDSIIWESPNSVGSKSRTGLDQFLRPNELSAEEAQTVQIIDNLSRVPSVDHIDIDQLRKIWTKNEYPDIARTAPALCETGAPAPYESPLYHPEFERGDDIQLHRDDGGEMALYDIQSYVTHQDGTPAPRDNIFPYRLYKTLDNIYLSKIHEDISTLQVKRWQGTDAVDVFRELWLATGSRSTGEIAGRLQYDSRDQVARILKDLAGVDDATTDVGRWQERPLVERRSAKFTTTGYGDLLGFCVFHIYNISAWMVSRLLGREDSYRTAGSPYESESDYFDQNNTPESATELIVDGLG